MLMLSEMMMMVMAVPGDAPYYDQLL